MKWQHWGLLYEEEHTDFESIFTLWHPRRVDGQWELQSVSPYYTDISKLEPKETNLSYSEVRRTLTISARKLSSQVHDCRIWCIDAVKEISLENRNVNMIPKNKIYIIGFTSTELEVKLTSVNNECCKI